jgi:hypothetical protein
MAKLEPSPPHQPDMTLEKALDQVGIAREQLVSIERTLERLRSDIAKIRKSKGGSGEK